MSIALTALSSLAAIVTVCASFAPLTPSGVVPLAVACAALFAVSFVPLALGHDFALKKLRSAMILWPLAGFAGAAFVRAEGVTVRNALLFSIAAACAAYAAFRASSLPGSPNAAVPQARVRKPLAAVDRGAIATMTAGGFSARTAVIVATPGWLIAAQIALAGVCLTAVTLRLVVVDVVPQAAEPGNLAAAIVAAIAYVRCHYYLIGWFSFHPTETTRRAVALFFALTVVGCAAAAFVQIGVLEPLDAARFHRSYARAITIAIVVLAAVSAAIDAFVTRRVLGLDIARLAERGYRFDEA